MITWWIVAFLHSETSSYACMLFNISTSGTYRIKQALQHKSHHCQVNMSHMITNDKKRAYGITQMVECSTVCEL